MSIVADGAAAVPNPRRRNVQANRHRDTGSERVLRSALHTAGLRYRCDFRFDLPDGRRVRPDIVFTRKRIAVFVDGCFWHSCPEHGRAPRAETGYWSPKLARNRERDGENTESLRATRWTAIRLWEHQGVAEGLRLVQAAVARTEQGCAGVP